jgi:hypothetical protein
MDLGSNRISFLVVPEDEINECSSDAQQKNDRHTNDKEKGVVGCIDKV